ncbi:MAG: type II toxin-antitoxin system RelE/ParE family toxin [Lachnospiraceae bacterium]|nr:type II toxin-antitoxin system RelE/ParE family toxin [Lachnospiraceae bacterium]
MNYSIHITSKAECDLNEAADYIEFTLLNPDAADNLLNKAEEEINKLAFMPQKYKIVDDPVLAAWGIRLVIINNYLAFYVIDEESKTVHIVRFLYGKRNWISILRNDPITFS